MIFSYTWNLTLNYKSLCFFASLQRTIFCWSFHASFITWFMIICINIERKKVIISWANSSRSSQEQEMTSFPLLAEKKSNRHGPYLGKKIWNKIDFICLVQNIWAIMEHKTCEKMDPLWPSGSRCMEKKIMLLIYNVFYI